MRFYNIQITHADEPTKNRVYYGEPIIAEWDEWPWLQFAESIIEDPGFHSLEYTVGLVHVKVTEEVMPLDQNPP